MLGIQIYKYLKLGAWGPVSLLDVLAPHVPWLSNPQSWIGLHGIVRNACDIMPVSLALIILGWLVAGFGAALRQRVRR